MKKIKAESCVIKNNFSTYENNNLWSTHDDPGGDN